MANCHELFEVFQGKISIPSDKRERMIKSKKGLRERIRNDFKKNHPGYVPKFYVQGSDKMKTPIRTKDDICDLDDGVYFLREPDVTATTLQQWVWDAANGYTSEEPEHRKKCIRNIFKGDYEIDMPVYYKVDGKEYQLAVKDNGFENSDPKGVVDWFYKARDKEGKLIEIVKDLKAWGDNIRNKMPSGLAMTILAVNAKKKFYYNERQDITLRDTLKEIRKALQEKFECKVPAEPFDDLFKDFPKERKDNFMKALDDFINDADSAIKESNPLRASKLWRKHLSDRFPLGRDEDENNTVRNTLVGGAVGSKPWAA